MVIRCIIFGYNFFGGLLAEFHFPVPAADKIQGFKVAGLPGIVMVAKNWNERIIGNLLQDLAVMPEIFTDKEFFVGIRVFYATVGAVHIFFMPCVGISKAEFRLDFLLLYDEEESVLQADDFIGGGNAVFPHALTARINRLEDFQILSHSGFAEGFFCDFAGHFRFLL